MRRPIIAAACLLLGVGCVSPKPGTDRADAGAFMSTDAMENQDAADGLDADTSDALETDGDANTEDAEPNDAFPTDTGPRDAGPPLMGPTTVGISNGAGTMRSQNYRLDLRVAGSGPVGNAASASYRIRIGPP